MAPLQKKLQTCKIPSNTYEGKYNDVTNSNVVGCDQTIRNIGKNAPPPDKMPPGGILVGVALGYIVRFPAAVTDGRKRPNAAVERQSRNVLRRDRTLTVGYVLLEHKVSHALSTYSARTRQEKTAVYTFIYTGSKKISNVSSSIT